MTTTENQTKVKTPTNIASARKSRATRAADKNDQTPKTPDPKPAVETPKTETPPKIDMGSRMVEVWTPSVTFSDGTEAHCPHSKYGHENLATTKSCITRMINLHQADH
jgi:hypothetical protein